jgi:hypothetical protein
MPSHARAALVAATTVALSVVSVAGMAAPGALGDLRGATVESTLAPSPVRPGPSNGVAAAGPANVSAPGIRLGRPVGVATQEVAVVTVSDHAAPRAHRPRPSGTHWASAVVQRCGDPDDGQVWALTLLGGGRATELHGWTGTTGVVPSMRRCSSRMRLFAVPDGARITGVRLAAQSPRQARRPVTWLVP